MWSHEQDKHKIMNNTQYIAQTLIGFLSPSINAFRAMTGCKSIIVDEKNFSVKCMLPLTVTGRKWNVLEIRVNGLDLVDVKCSKVTTRNFKSTTKVVHEWENLYGEDVHRIFREATGVATRLW
jgi:hypothetical protein